MPKIKLKIKINDKKNPIWEGFGIKNDHKLIYYDGNTKTEIIQMETIIKIIRTNPDYIINLYLSKNNAKAIYRMHNHYLELPISNVKIVNQNSKIKIEYHIEEEIFKIEIEYEVLK